MEPLPLHFIHEKRGARFGDLNGREVLLRGDGLAALQAAREAVVLFDASAREWLRVTGEDRASFLHGMCTNDVNKLPVGSALYAAFLTPKGAMVGDGRLFKRESDLLVDLEPGLGGKVREFLDKFLISEDAELLDASGELALFTLGGPKAPALLESLGLSVPTMNASAEGTVAGVAVTLVGNDLVLAHGVDVRLPREGAEAVWGALVDAGSALGLKLLGLDELEVLRVEAGLPRYGADMDDKTIPLEANLERAIHYNKGCYIGQEVIARATFRGHMNRKLTGLLLGGAAPAEGEAFSDPVRRLERGEAAPEGRVELFAGEKKVGWLTTGAWSSKLGQAISLGYVHRDFLTAGTKLSIAGGGEAEVRELPFVPRG